MTTPLLIAHRGESHDAPENTMAAFELAWERGAQAIECDVRQTADDRIVVFHDVGTRRICGVSGRVPGHSWSTLRKMDVGRWKGSCFVDQRIPLLSDLLETVPDHGRVFIEIKAGVEILPKLKSVVTRAQIRKEQALIMSFDKAVVSGASHALPGYPTALITSAAAWTRGGGVGRFCRMARSIGCDALNLEVHRRLNRTVIDQIHDEGLKVYCWTANRFSTALRLATAGIDGIATDRCAWMGEKFRLAGSRAPSE